MFIDSINVFDCCLSGVVTISLAASIINLLMIFANSPVDPDKDQYVKPDLGPNCLTLRSGIPFFLKKKNNIKISTANKEHVKLSSKLR